MRVDTKSGGPEDAWSWAKGPRPDVPGDDGADDRDDCDRTRSQGSPGTSDSLARNTDAPDHGDMKRLIAGPLWFLSVWYGFELLWVLMGVPRVLGPIVAASIAMIVWVDPMHWFWPARAPRTTRSSAPAGGVLQPSAK